MHTFPPASELDFLIGETLEQVCLGPFITRFEFERSSITCKLAVELTEPDGTSWTYKCVATEAPASMLHRIIGRQIVAIDRDDLRLSLRFDNSAVLHVLSDLGPYESGQIGSGDSLFIF